MAQELRTNIVINARTEGFEQIGNTLMTMGSMLSGMSDRVIEFGKDSLNVYRDYEKAMVDAEIALSTKYGRGTRELAQVMSKLDEQATQWAANTVFNTNDVANAISNAAHAGWDYEKIIEGMPAAMYLAQAGSMDLSQAVDYIVKSTNSLGVEFDKTTDFVDMWTYAANSSATTIDEVGQAMLRMGGTMKFADNEAELLTMIAVLANAGTTGESAGTLLRNSMLRLIAPTKKAADVMAGLGVDSAEAAEIMNDANVEAANAQLTMHGFSAYDENGELKPMLDTFTDLYSALVDINGGVEGLFDNKDVLGIISAIFPTRSITGAIALLNAAADGYDGLYEAMMGGAAGGYGEWAAKLENEAYWGAEKLFKSKIERLQQVVGEELSGKMEDIFVFLGGIVDTIAELDDDSLSMLVNNMAILGIAGPGLMLTGFALKTLVNPIGLLALGAVGVGMLANSLVQMAEIDYASHFGSIELDPTVITDYLTHINDAFTDSYAALGAYDDALESAFSNYETLGSDIQTKLITGLVTEHEFTPDEIDQIVKMADDMFGEVDKAIEARYAKTFGSMSALFGGDEQMFASEAWDGAFSVIMASYEADIETAENLSQRMRDALTKHLKGGLTPEEEEDLLQIFRDANELMARQAEAEQQGKYASEFARAQVLGIGSIEEYSKTAHDEFLEDQALFASTRAEARATISSYYDRAIEEAETQAEKDTLIANRDLLFADMDASYYPQLASMWMSTAGHFENMFGIGIKGSDLADEWEALETATALYASKGYSIDKEVVDAMAGYEGESDALSQYTKGILNAFGGREVIESMVAEMAANGQTEVAEYFQNLLAMDYLTGGSALLRGNYGKGENLENAPTLFDENAGSFDALESIALAYGATNLQTFADYIRRNADDTAKSYWGESFLGGGSILGVDADTYAALVTNAERSGFIERASGDVNEGVQQMLYNAINGSMEGYVSPIYGELLDGVVFDEPGVRDGFADAAKTVADAVFPGWVDNGLVPLVEEMGKLPDFFASLAPPGPDEYENVPAAIEREPAPETTQIEAAWGTDEGMSGPPIQQTVELVGDTSTLGDDISQVTDEPIEVPVQVDQEQLATSIEEQSGTAEVASPEITPTVNWDTIQEKLDEYAVTGFIVPAKPEMGELEAALEAMNGTPVTAAGHLDPSGIDSTIASRQGTPLYLTAVVTGGGIASGTGRGLVFAEGGRADTASIFGEAGPEWAIPEQHTERTAELLNAAREASGFTWPELINRFGGLNSDPNHTPTTLVYSPTINAVDANGVAAVLAADKTRLEQWWEDKQTRDAVEVYA